MGLINDFGKGIKLSKVLGVTSNRNRLVNGLVATAIQHELDGINIDFEHVTKRYCTRHIWNFYVNLLLRATQMI